MSLSIVYLACVLLGKIIIGLLSFFRVDNLMFLKDFDGFRFVYCSIIVWGILLFRLYFLCRIKKIIDRGWQYFNS